MRHENANLQSIMRKIDFLPSYLKQCQDGSILDLPRKKEISLGKHDPRICAFFSQEYYAADPRSPLDWGEI